MDVYDIDISVIYIMFFLCKTIAKLEFYIVFIIIYTHCLIANNLLLGLEF